VPLVDSLELTDFISYLFGKHTIISSIFAINRKIFRVFWILYAVYSWILGCN